MLYDEILAHPAQSMCEGEVDKIRPMILGFMEKATRIKADNVAEYLFVGTPQEEWDLIEDFPKPVPPFPVTWIEWAWPRFSNSNGVMARSEHYGMRGATLIVTETMENLHALELSDEDKLKSMLQSMALADDKTRAILQEHRPDVRECPPEIRQKLLAQYERLRQQLVGQSQHPQMPYWGLAVFLFLEIRGVNGDLPCLVPAESRFMLSRSGDVLPVPGRPGPHPPAFFSTPLTERLTQGLPSQLFFIPLLTLSFLNCKNVLRVAVQPPEKLNKARVRRGKLPLVSYYTLEITPMKEVLRIEGRSEETGLRRAWHQCRGHFADYTQGKGLFGKYHGQFWVPMHMRGTHAAGEVIKDYAVNKPAE